MNRAEKISYCKRIESYVREIAPGRYVDEIYNMVVQRYPADITEQFIANFLNRKKIETGMRTKIRRDRHPNTIFHQEQVEFVKNHYDEWDNARMYAEITARWPELPGLSYTALSRFRRNNGLVYRKYTPVIDEYIREHLQQDYTTLAKDISQKFNRTVCRKKLAAYISYKREMISMEDFYEIRDMFVPFNLPISIDNCDPEKILEILYKDKKNDKDSVNMVLLKRIGKAFVCNDIKKDMLLMALEELNFKEED